MPLFEKKHEELRLRDYQQKAIDDIRQAMVSHSKVVACLPTGAGKTIIATYIVQQLAKRGVRCCFCVETIQLIDQTVATFSKYGIRCGVIQADHPLHDPAADVQIVSVQTLRNRKYEAFDFFIQDECHVFFAHHEKMIAECKHAIGFSATPYRSGLGKHYEAIVSPIAMRELIAKGYLKPFRVFGPKTINMDGARTVAGDFAKNDMAERADKAKITGDIVQHWKKHAVGRKTICFCVNVAHVKHLARGFSRNGIMAEEVHSYQSKDGMDSERKQAMDNFIKGDAEVICSVDILGRGFDYPEVSCVILARPTKSMMVHQQQVGRGLRKGGWEDCLILDHAGNHERLGFVDEYSIDELDDGENKRNKKKKKEREEKLPKPCPSCDYMKPAGQHECVACGFTPENIADIETAEGELKELKRAKSDRKKYTVVEKQEFLGGLNTYAFEKGYKCSAKGNYGWAINKYNEKFGCSPSSKISWNMQCEINDDVKNFIKSCNIRFAKSKAGRDWQRKKNEELDKRNVKYSCKKCGSSASKEIVGIFGPHKIKRVCANCQTFIKWN